MRGDLTARSSNVRLMFEVAWCGLVLLLLSGVSVAGGLDKPAFTASADELLAAAHAVPAGDAAVVVLRDETRIAYDARGRAERQYRTVFVVEQPSAIDGWGTLQIDWSPFYQDKPNVKARVISPQGKIAELDPSLVTDAPTVTDSPSVYSDRRELEAPLPRLVVGAVVEETYTIRDREPLLSQGVVEHVVMGGSTPEQRAILTIETPVGHALRVLPRGFATPPRMHQEIRHGVTVRTYDVGPVPALAYRPAGVPSDVATWPSVGIATGASWAAVADGYRRIVDQRIAQGPVELTADLRGATPAETVDRILASVQAHVRYTGIELSDAEIAPWPPAKTLDRGFGDCKDKATLVVALLRAAGIDASVALLSTGPGLDVDPGLPGIGEFDHAIVRAVVGGKPVWIDATADELPAGQLPVDDQGRRALVIAPGTRALVMTPVATPADNVIREVRTYHFPEQGLAHVTEVTTERGAFSDDLRSWYHSSDHAALEKNLSSYVAGVYDGKLVTFSGTTAAVTQPFTFTVEVSDVGRALTGRENVDAYLSRGAAMVQLPPILRKADDEIDAAVRARRHDYVWSKPHVYEVENRLELPVGYTAPQLPPHEQIALGTMTLTTDRRVEGNTLVITYRLDTGKLRLTPAELAATRDAVQQLYAGPQDHIVVEQTGAELLREGKVMDAIAEYRRLVALHPKEALHRDQLADAYRRAGMGMTARRIAQEAVAIEPTADAYDMLAWQLRRDAFGRDFGLGADRAGAIAAYRKAIALDPAHEGALADFASLLVHDERGRPTSSDADRREAISLWQRAKASSKSTRYDAAIVLEMLRAGELAEAETAARAMQEGDARSEFVLVAVAARQGAPAALALVDSLVAPDRRDHVLASVVVDLMHLRRYDEARAIDAQVHGTDATSVAAHLAGSVKPFDLAKLDPSDPRTPALRAVLAITGVGDGHDPPWNAEYAAWVREQHAVAMQVKGMKAFARIPPLAGRDLMASFVTMTVDGDAATGWHVVVSEGANRVSLYVVRTRGRATLLASIDDPVGLGRRVLALVDKGQLATATRWVRWFAADLALEPNARYAPLAKLFDAPSGNSTLDKGTLELAAALMLIWRAPAEALPILQRAKVTGAREDTRQRALLDANLAVRRWRDALVMLRAYVIHDPADLSSVVREARVLVRVGRAHEAADVLDHALAAHPDDHVLLSARAQVSLGAEPWPLAQQWVDKVLACPGTTILDLNNLAWSVVFHAPTPDLARPIAERIEQASTTVTPMVANTLATIEADTGHPYRAWTYLQQSLDAHPDAQPAPDDWYVIGRIAESYGLRDEAIAAYRRIAKSETDSPAPTGYDFASRRLAKLGVH